MIEIFTEKQLNEILEKNKEKVVLADFYASWCGPCKLLVPELEQLTKKYENIVIVKINVDESIDLAEKYEVTAMPTLIFFKNAELAQTEVGFKNWQMLGEIVENLKK